MKPFFFSELLNLPFDPNSGRIDEADIQRALSNTPRDVVQLLSEHGRNSDFQKQYGPIDIGSLIWERREICATDLRVSVFPPFKRYFDAVVARASAVVANEWRQFDSRSKVRNHWRSQKTWLVPPAILDCNVLGHGQQYHLMEGHTRIGSLHGLMNAGMIDPQSRHSVWIARRG